MELLLGALQPVGGDDGDVLLVAEEIQGAISTLGVIVDEQDAGHSEASCFY